MHSYSLYMADRALEVGFCAGLQERTACRPQRMTRSKGVSSVSQAAWQRSNQGEHRKLHVSLHTPRIISLQKDTGLRSRRLGVAPGNRQQRCCRPPPAHWARSVGIMNELTAEESGVARAVIPPQGSSAMFSIPAAALI